MAETTNISWCDSTWNPWIGCTKVSPGCDHCYAEALDKRHRWKGDTHWGSGKPRMRTSAANWAKPLAWNKARQKDGKTHRVFCASLADVFDNEVPHSWRIDLWALIEATPALTWLLLTKRIGNAAKMLPWKDQPWPHVWIGASVVNQEEADRDLPKLQSVDAEKRFVSYEPALGPVDWDRFLSFGGIDQVIVGGESTQGKHAARRFAIERARKAKHACDRHGVSFFMKQAGAHVTWDGQSSSPEERWPPGTRKEDHGEGYFRIRLKDRAGADPAEWPEDLRVQSFPA